MTLKNKKERNLKIVEFRKEHTLFETALEFDISIAHICRIVKKVKAEGK